MERDDPLAEDITAIQQMALEVIHTDPARAERLLRVAQAAGAWHTLLMDPKLKRRFGERGWVSYLLP
jgi:hypothetical protein